jgi:Ca2+-transporting ATPase
MVAILLGQWLIVTFGGQMFRTTPLSLIEWTVIIVVTSAVVWIKELYRLCKR